MVTTTTKESRLNIRCDNRTRQLLDKAASYAHVSIAEFVLSHALASAKRVVQEHESITLKPKDFEAFLKALDAPSNSIVGSVLTLLQFVGMKFTIAQAIMK